MGQFYLSVTHFLFSTVEIESEDQAMKNSQATELLSLRHGRLCASTTAAADSWDSLNTHYFETLMHCIRRGTEASSPTVHCTYMPPNTRTKERTAKPWAAVGVRWTIAAQGQASCRNSWALLSIACSDWIGCPRMRSRLQDLEFTG